MVLPLRRTKSGRNDVSPFTAGQKYPGVGGGPQLDKKNGDNAEDPQRALNFGQYEY